MTNALYDRLVPWYALLDPLEEHEGETALYTQILGGAATLLELGSGAGNNAHFMKRAFECTLSDLSEPMLALSRAQNPDCAHVAGDMRTLRLDRSFDAVLVHDAICYMHTVEDLRAAAQTAFVHTRPGGSALFAPDTIRERFCESTHHLSGASGARTLHALEWSWDPDPADTSYTVEYNFLLRDGLDVQAVHDRHIEGLFSGDTWREVLQGVGFAVECVTRPLDDDASGYFESVFRCRRPG